MSIAIPRNSESLASAAQPSTRPISGSDSQRPGITVVTSTWFQPRFVHTLPLVLTLGALFVCVFAGVKLPQLVPYPWYRVMHFFGAMMLIGSAVNTSVREAFTLALSSRSFTYYVYKWAGFADLFLFYPGGLLIAFAGASMTSILYGTIYASNWLFAANVSFLLSFITYVMLSRAQYRVQDLLLKDDQASEFSAEEVAFLRRSVRKEWTINAACGVFTMIPLVLMVLKPELALVTSVRLTLAHLFGVTVP